MLVFFNGKLIINKNVTVSVALPSMAMRFEDDKQRDVGIELDIASFGRPAQCFDDYGFLGTIAVDGHYHLFIISGFHRGYDELRLVCGVIAIDGLSRAWKRWE